MTSRTIKDRLQSDFDRMFTEPPRAATEAPQDRMARRAVEDNVAADRPAPSRPEYRS